MTKLQGESQEAFAALRELSRITKATLTQTFLASPLTYVKGFAFGSGLESCLRKEKFQDLFDECLADFEAELGPFYQRIFEKLHGENPLRFDSSRAVRPREVEALLTQVNPRWKDDFKLDPRAVHVTPLFQIHRAIDLDGKGWLVKVVKPLAREKLDKAVLALKEIEAFLKPFRMVPKVSKFLADLETVRLSYQREGDLRIERRTLERSSRQDSRITVHPAFQDRDVLVTADPTRMHADDVKNLARVLPFRKKKLSSPQTDTQSYVSQEATSS